MIKNHGTILRSSIGALPIQSRRIVVRPKNIKELVVADLRRIKFHFHHFSVSGLVCANIFIGRIVFRSARVAGHYVRYALDLAKRRFDSPKTSRTECRFLCHGVSIKQDWLRRNTFQDVVLIPQSREQDLAQTRFDCTTVCRVAGFEGVSEKSLHEL